MSTDLIRVSRPRTARAPPDPRKEDAMPPLAFDQELIEIVRAAAAPIPPVARSRFYEAVDRLLRVVFPFQSHDEYPQSSKRTLLRLL